MEGGTIVAAPLIGAGVAALAGLGAQLYSGQSASKARGAPRLFLTFLLILIGLGAVVALFGVPIAAFMFLFNDANVPESWLFEVYVVPMWLTIAWFGLLFVAVLRTIQICSHQKMLGVLLLTVALSLYFVGVPTASAAFGIAARFASNL